MPDLSVQLDFAARLVVAAALGALVGAEREIHGHPAGIRTHMLVALGSALFTVLSIHGFGQGPGSGIDPTRIAAQIVTGIGFLGAGAILKDGVVIRGLTTAASLWATAAVGLATGAGEYVIAVAAAAIILVSLWPINALAERLHGTTLPEVQLRLSLTHLESLGEISAALADRKVELASIATQRVGRDSYRADLSLRSRTAQSMAAALEAIDALPGVDVVSSSQAD
ncbi:MAG TPA: MgtC/SapB family protein [Candidatus Limnocylindrales bacterium]|nr:MgtC/SapB family protein [Candidatus Limnocylindrales bacterium]